MVFSFHARSKNAKQREISHNFYDECHESSNTFGIERFMPTKDLKKIAKNGKVKIRLRIKSIEPYFYLGIDPQNLKGGDDEGCTRGDLVDQCKNPLGLSLLPSEDNKVTFKLKYDPNGDNVALDEMPYFKKIYWRAIVNSFENDAETVVVASSDEAGKSSFCYSEAECDITSDLDMDKVTQTKRLEFSPHRIKIETRLRTSARFTLSQFHNSTIYPTKYHGSVLNE